MFCTKCGSEMPEDLKFCSNCGASLASESEVNNVAPVSEQSNEKIPNHLVGAIASTICCCIIPGIVAIVYATQVNTKLAQGDIEGAKVASKNAYIWIAVGVGLGVLVIFFQLLSIMLNCG